ncbi:putative uncharacterized protein YDL057W isoform X2 [Wolffia australiana]
MVVCSIPNYGHHRLSTSLGRFRNIRSGIFICPIKMSFGEDFALPKLRESKNKPTDKSSEPKLASCNISSGDDTADLSTRKRIFVENKHGETLVGVLHETRSKELIIFCHGFRSSKDSRTLLKIAEAFEEQGTAIFRFDFSGNGESEGSFQYGNYWKEVEDLRAVVLHFSRQGWRINSIIGHSKGGNVVLLYASIFNDIPNIINISGRFSLQKGIQERLGENYMERIERDGFIDVRNETGDLLYRVTEESLKDRLSIDMRSSCSLISRNCKVLTVHGSKDETVPVEDATEFANLIPDHELCILDGADHRYSEHSSQLVSCILEFTRLRA